MKNEDGKWHTCTIGIEIAASEQFFCQRCERPAIWYKKPFSLKCGSKHEWEVMVKKEQDQGMVVLREINHNPA